MTVMTVEQIEHFLDEVFPQRMGRVESVGEMSATMRLAVGYEHLRPGPRVSGPTMMGFADVALYVAILAQIGPEPMAVTSDFNCHFLRAASGEHDIIAHAKLIKLGRRLGVGEVQVFSAADETRPVVHVTASYALPAT
ncbi:PaaI family thioesterase [Vreelandella populi]|uniref:PaaI family thioesterase n=1 Tax=Vreelandella populi TaxID=2498858 RepID=UPI000F8DFBDC|nr:PaaI family thioesterase [Halomonas populi]RUR35584.1 PaaI family thioesterase [Halomonas populi]RUR54363.1 PaaI family thioesterase [Halomonas populi]